MKETYILKVYTLLWDYWQERRKKTVASWPSQSTALVGCHSPEGKTVTLCMQMDWYGPPQFGTPTLLEFSRCFLQVHRISFPFDSFLLWTTKAKTAIHKYRVMQAVLLICSVLVMFKCLFWENLPLTYILTCWCVFRNVLHLMMDCFVQR